MEGSFTRDQSAVTSTGGMEMDDDFAAATGSSFEHDVTPALIQYFFTEAKKAESTQNWGLADAHYVQILKYVNHPEALKNLAYLRMNEAKRYNDALYYYNQILANDNTDADALIGSAWCLWISMSRSERHEALNRILFYLHSQQEVGFSNLMRFIYTRRTDRKELEVAIDFLHHIRTQIFTSSGHHQIDPGILEHSCYSRKVRKFREKMQQKYINYQDDAGDEEFWPDLEAACERHVTDPDAEYEKMQAQFMALLSQQPQGYDSAAFQQPSAVMMADAPARSDVMFEPVAAGGWQLPQPVELLPEESQMVDDNPIASHDDPDEEGERFGY